MDVHGAAVGDVALWVAALLALYRNRLPRAARSWPSWGRWSVVGATVVTFVFAAKVAIDPPLPADHSTAIGWLWLVAIIAGVLLIFGIVCEARRASDDDAKHQRLHNETREQNERLREHDREEAERRREEEREGLLTAVRDAFGERDPTDAAAAAPGSDEAEALALAADLLRMVNVQEVTDPFFPYFKMLRSDDPAMQAQANELMQRDLTPHYNHHFRTTGIYLNNFADRVNAVVRKLLPKNNGGNQNMNITMRGTLPLSAPFIRQIASYLRALAGGEVYDDSAQERAEARAVEQQAIIAAVHRQVHSQYMREQRMARDNLWKRARNLIWAVETLTIPLKKMAASNHVVFDIMHAADPVAKTLATGDDIANIIADEKGNAIGGFHKIWDDLEPMLGEFDEFGVRDPEVAALANGGYPEYDDIDKISGKLLTLNTSLKDINLND